MLIESINRFVFDSSVGNTFMIALLNVDGLWLMAIVLRCGCWMLNKTTRDDLPLILSIAYCMDRKRKKNVWTCVFIVCGYQSPGMRSTREKKFLVLGRNESNQCGLDESRECETVVLWMRVIPTFRDRNILIVFAWHENNLFMHLALDFAISFHSICFLSCHFDDFVMAQNVWWISIA